MFIIWLGLLRQKGSPLPTVVLYLKGVRYFECVNWLCLCLYLQQCLCLTKNLCISIEINSITPICQQNVVYIIYLTYLH